MVLKFREIEVFWAVYKGQSVKEAANLLNVSQPAISMMLKSAEERFGVKLFERSGGRVKPTAEARALFPAANNVFAELKELERQLVRVREGRAGVVRIAATPTLAAAFLHPSLPGFQQQHPDARVTIRTVSTEHTVDLVARGGVDLGLAYGPTDHSDTQADDLCVAEVACVFRHDHRLAEKLLVTPADLVGESPLTYRSETPLGREIEKTFRDAGVDLRFTLQSTALTAAHLADCGLGVALIDPFVLSGELFQNLTVRPFKPTTSARVQIVTARGQSLSLICQDLLEHIRKNVPQQFSFAVPIRNEATA